MTLCEQKKVSMMEESECINYDYARTNLICVQDSNILLINMFLP